MRVQSCPCGQGHNVSLETLRFLHRMQQKTGKVTIDVVTPDGAWAVPRLYIAVHGLKAVDLPRIAPRLKFQKVD